MIEEGQKCHCGGTFVIQAPENCSCHLNATCSACTDCLLACDKCSDTGEMPLSRALELVIEASMHCSPAQLPGFDGYPIDVCRDNYKLMSAAPEMLKELKLMLVAADLLRVTLAMKNINISDDHVAIKKMDEVKQLIKKLEGK